MATAARTPLHLWVVGLVALLWNCIGAFDYLMTRFRNVDYFKAMMPDTDPQAVLAWVDAFPLWAQFGWGLGVWGGLLGSVLLLARSRWAVPVFAASLVGAILGLGYQIALAPPMPGMDGPGGKIMPVVIILVALALLLYARSMRARGVLR
jgi:hypothetical protein